MSVAAMFTPVDGITRDRWGRPLILPIGGGKPVGYTRVSTMSKALDDTEGLTKWKMRQTVAGIAKRPDLLALAASAGDDKTTLNRVASEAMDAASSSAAANTGTALHSFTELADTGGDLTHLPMEYRADIAAYRAAMAPLRILAMEQFVVIDELSAAGSFDRLVAMPNGKIRVADMLTGKDAPTYAGATSAQIAMYAHGSLYDHATGARHPLPMIDTQVGLLIHLPAGTGTCTIYEVDLVSGWVAANIAKAIRDWRKIKPVTVWAP